MHAAHFRAHNKIIFPPTLRLLPLWTLGEPIRGMPHPISPCSKCCDLASIPF